MGSIQYVVHCTRPDVAYALSVTSRYQTCIGEAHWSTIKTILKYMRMTKDIFLIYGCGELILEGYSGASFQLDDDDQATTADSTIEAEYIAALEVAKEAVWMKNYIQEFVVVPSIAEPIVIFCDNNGAVAQAKEPRSHHRSKHIDRHYHLLREMESRGDIRMDRFSSAETQQIHLSSRCCKLLILNIWIRWD
ncbi:UNVERIFIED_CONTAM: Retrovirus-related Pol polyprotein from transposon TNT 1-94 [Sesamum angustifolium]|uniref:Retrovirus-related Pol polyprotein from transposon TNT 1-94 n=1 Tax=Sesamum angustifolium TaxID=2727405 RepID=A0AAW2JEZ6_9LAMI